MKNPVSRLKAIDKKSGDLNVIIETPKGSRNKYNYNPKNGMYELGALLHAGASFPYDFGFIPSTEGGDGDPLDVLMLMEESAFTGCLVKGRLIGVIEAEQTEKDNEVTRNDRLIAIASASHLYEEIKHIKDLPKPLLEAMQHFFISYNEFKGKKFKVLGIKGPQEGGKIVKEGKV